MILIYNLLVRFFIDRCGGVIKTTPDGSGNQITFQLVFVLEPICLLTGYFLFIYGPLKHPTQANRFYESGSEAVPIVPRRDQRPGPGTKIRDQFLWALKLY